jgi:hypothetical protein
MLSQVNYKLLRIAFLSKNSTERSVDLPILKQIQVSAEIENKHNAIDNIILSIILSGGNPQFKLLNSKQATVLPRIILSKQQLILFVSEVLSLFILRLTPKLITNTFLIISNKLSFTFKSSDLMPLELQKL